MLFKNYHIVIFKDREGVCSNLRLRGWFGAVVVLLVIGLSVGNFYLWGFYHRAQQLEHQLQEAQKNVQEQTSLIVSMASKLQTLQESLTRVQQFDAKLRVMMNVDRDPVDTSGAADTPENAASASPYLPLHRQDLLARRMHSLAEQLKEDVLLEEIGQQDLLQVLRDNKEFLSSTPSIWPAEGHISSTFGYRYSPFTGQSQLHAGLDISNRPGTPVIAPAKGVVTFSGWDGAYGTCIIINHGNGISTRYAHLQKSVVKEGQMLGRGDLIAHVGNSGRSTGPHLHYEVRVGGVCVNPMRYILN